jgi:hypothetical protein
MRLLLVRSGLNNDGKDDAARRIDAPFGAGA